MFASLGMFVQIVNVVLVGLLTGAVLLALGAASGWAIAAALATALVTLALDFRQALRAYGTARAGFTPLRRTPPD